MTETSAPITTSPVITRYAGNPVLSRADVPYHATMVFNAGVCKFQGRYVMVFRNDYGEFGNPQLQGTNLGLAFSDDGIHWQVEPTPCWELPAVIEAVSPLYGGTPAKGEIWRAYDPRLTVIEGQCYMTFALDTAHGLRGGVARTEDFYHYEVTSLSLPDNRNMVLLPERVGGQYVRLDRPMPIYSRVRERDRFDIWLTTSPDLQLWGRERLVLGVEDVPWANDKIGPAAPPVKTDKGWLTLFHAVDLDRSRGKNGWEERWQKRYSIGVMLLDLEDPARVVAMSKEPLLAPEHPLETSNGYRHNAVFPGGMILEPDGEVKIYYGAADTVECLATAHVDDLLALCNAPR